eukprot:TRINITY_DN9966_c0_g1_i5.p1 TRINITY_DN9966_c0_g1~~TRINITY_DN9966_c0_g1_i5.p1  ORF type:complete len:205 (-),score=12.06 TRINITY_DN9966_c0_g1_i5:28-642(-)
MGSFACVSAFLRFSCASTSFPSKYKPFLNAFSFHADCGFNEHSVRNVKCARLCNQSSESLWITKAKRTLSFKRCSNATEGNYEESDLPPPGCSRVKVELSKPLGIVLEEDQSGKICVAELVKGGNAEKSGLVELGDQLIATSAVVYGNVESYQGVKVRKDMQIVRLNVRGERFETVMAAIGTHPGYMKKCNTDLVDTGNSTFNN